MVAVAVKRHVSTFNDSALSGIVRYCAIVCQHGENSTISFGDPEERVRVREEFLKKKLGLTQPDAELDAVIATVARVMTNSKATNRVTAYYLLAERFGKLSLFV